VTAMRIIGEFVSDLGRQVPLHKLSLNLNEETRIQRKAQLEGIEAEVRRLWEALGEGNMAGVVRGHKALKGQLEEYYGGLETIGEGENASSDSAEPW
jgi:hypothetical protein